MDNQDKIFDKFKEASHNAEAKDFPAMEKVWSRVEEKLDKKEDKKTISLWKKIAAAASLLLVISLGSQFIKSDKNTGIQNQEVVVNEKSEANKTQSTIEKSDAVVSSSEIVPKAEATQILEKQINREPVAINEVQSLNNPVITTQAAPAMGSGIAITPQAEVGSDENESYNNNSLLKENKASANHYLQADKKASFDMAKDESRAKVARKPAPLVVLNGSAIAHSDAAKKDKMMRNELPNLRPENVDSLVILDEPLYIIDGIYYSENDLFGDNPTSPYAPLDKQDIKTMTILQDLEATSKYGEKGKKGVVIITTKNGKPSLKK